MVFNTERDDEKVGKSRIFLIPCLIVRRKNLENFFSSEAFGEAVLCRLFVKSYLTQSPNRKYKKILLSVGYVPSKPVAH